MWGGRFSKATNKLLEDLNASIKYDYRLAKYDIEVSIAHVMMLAKSGVISKEECQLIVNGLKKVQKEINRMVFKGSSEDESVVVTINGKLEITNVELSDYFSSSDSRQQTLLIKTAVNNAIASAQKTTQEKMNSATGGMLGDMNIPGL